MAYLDSNTIGSQLYLRGPEEPVRTNQLQDMPEMWAAVPLQELQEEPLNLASNREHPESPGSPDSAITEAIASIQAFLDSYNLPEQPETPISPEIPISPEYRPTSPESLRRVLDPTAPVFCPTTDQIRQESHKYCIGCQQGCISQELRFCLGCMVQCPHHKFMYVPRPALTQTANQGSSIQTYQVALPQGNLQVQLKQVELHEIYHMDVAQPEPEEPLNLTWPSTRTSSPLLSNIKVEPEEQEEPMFL